MLNNIDYRQLNISVFKDTDERCRTNARLRESIAQSRQAQKFTGERESVAVENRNIYATQAKVTVSQKRTFEAAQTYAGTRVAVLNFASASSPGGGVTTGAGAQEESLCRCSTLYHCLTDKKMLELFYIPHRRNRTALHTDDCIYTPGVTVFKTDVSAPELLSEKDWYSVDVITCAAPNLRYGDVTITDEALKQLHIKRLRRILDIAVTNKVENIVLGAFGCGAFMNDPKVVASATAEVIRDYLFVDRNYGLAEKLYRKAADQGNANAQRGLGNCYYNGKGVAQDFSEAAKWYCKSAEQGDSIAQFVLGDCYEKGKGVAKDIDEAVKWYRKAAEQGQKDAIKALKRLGK